MTATTMRLPGSVAEIQASKEGPSVAALFDLDGTLIAGYSARHLQQQRFRNREVGLSELVRTLAVAVGVGLGRAEFADLLKLGAEAWRGRTHEDLEEMGERLFRQKIEPLIYPEVRDLVIAHQRRGHTVVLSSSATSYQVEPVARFLCIDHVLCNRFELADGVLTGNIVTPVLWGPGKSDSVQKFVRDYGIDLADSYFYADGNEDLALMHLVGHPRPTNPGKQLESVARARGWPVLKFTSRSSDGRGARLRMTAGLATILPIGAVGAAVGVATRSRRQAINFVTRRWLDTMFQINGVRLEVAGRENLWATRPALFIFNHRNNFDPFIAARLVERDFIAVAKKELQNDPLIGTFGRLADVAFIDRANPKAAVATLRHLQERAREGMSIIVAPEGTRHDTTEVGPFKKGVFRVAMAAGVPLVPIVFHDADLIASRNSSTMNAGTVHVTVLPPVRTDDWTKVALGDRVVAVRQQFLDTLRAGFTLEQNFRLG